MQHRQIPVACIQTSAHDRAEFPSAWPRILALVDEAGKRGASLVVLPEGTVPGYVLGMQPVPFETIVRATDDLASLARAYGTTIVCGVAKIVDGATYNAAIAIGPDGRELGFSAKQFLWHFDRRWFAAGRTLEPIATPVGKLGILVCADGRIPTIAATLCERGAELLVMPTAWVTSGRDPGVFENIQADLMANVRARENGVPFVIANKVGFERASVAYCGKSAIMDATGAFVARGNERDETIVMGTVTLAAVRDGRAERTIAFEDGAGTNGAATLRRSSRVAFTMATDASETAALAACAADADANVFLSLGGIAPLESDRVHEIDGFRCAIVRSQTMCEPRGLVPARLAGIDAFLWPLDDPDGDWALRYARTRAAELRAYIVVFDRANDRSYAIDPDGVVISGTFAGLRLAAFVFDPARTAATMVAPTTDVLAGLRTAETIRTTARTERVHAG